LLATTGRASRLARLAVLCGLILPAGVTTSARADVPTSWTGPAVLTDSASESRLQPVTLGTDGLALGWTWSRGAVVAYRAQGEAALRRPLMLARYDAATQTTPTGEALGLQDGDGLAVATSEFSDRTLVIAPDGSRGTLQDWGDGCGIAALADSSAGTVAVRLCDDGTSLSYSLTRRTAGSLSFGSPVPAPIAGGDLPELATDAAGDSVAAWLDNCDFDVGACDVVAAAATPDGAWSSPRAIGTVTQVAQQAGIPEPLVSIDDRGDGLIAWPEEHGTGHDVMAASVSKGTTIGDPQVLATDTAPIATLYDLEIYHGSASVVWLTDVTDYRARLAGASRATGTDAMTTDVLAPAVSMSIPFDLASIAGAASADQRTLAIGAFVPSVGPRAILWRAGAADFATTIGSGRGDIRVSVGDGGTALATWSDDSLAQYAVADATDAAFSAPDAIPYYHGWVFADVADQAVDRAGDVLIEANDKGEPSPAPTQAYTRPANGTFGTALPGTSGAYAANSAGALIFSPTDAFLMRHGGCGAELGYWILTSSAIPSDFGCAAGAPDPLDISDTARPIVRPPAPTPPAVVSPSGTVTPGNTANRPTDPALVVTAPARTALASQAGAPPRVHVALTPFGAIAITVACRGGCAGKLTVRVLLGAHPVSKTFAVTQTGSTSHRYTLRFSARSRTRLRTARRGHRLPLARVQGRLISPAGARWAGTLSTRTLKR
jgi:hypothetical protein